MCVGLCAVFADFCHAGRTKKLESWHLVSGKSHFLFKNNRQEYYSLGKYLWSLWLALFSTVLDIISSLQ